MNLNFLVDQNISINTTKFLRSLNLSIYDVRELGLKGKSDEEIYDYAKKENLVIITFDHEFAYSFLNKKDLTGLIILRIHPQTQEIINKILKDFFNKINEIDIKGNIIILEKHKFRKRNVIK